MSLIHICHKPLKCLVAKDMLKTQRTQNSCHPQLLVWKPRPTRGDFIECKTTGSMQGLRNCCFLWRQPLSAYEKDAGKMSEASHTVTPRGSVSSGKRRYPEGKKASRSHEERRVPAERRACGWRSSNETTDTEFKQRQMALIKCCGSVCVCVCVHSCPSSYSHLKDSQVCVCVCVCLGQLL